MKKPLKEFWGISQTHNPDQHNQEFSVGEPLPVNCWDDSTVFVSPDTEHLGTPWPGGVGLWEQLDDTTCAGGTPGPTQDFSRLPFLGCAIRWRHILSRRMTRMSLCPLYQHLKQYLSGSKNFLLHSFCSSGSLLSTLIVHTRSSLH